MKVTALRKSLPFIKSWLRLRYERSEIPGFVVAISHKGKLLLNEAYGYADLETKEKLTTDHVFRVASHSKTFTATAVLQLAEQGKLRIDDAIADYLPWLKRHKDKRIKKVTIRQLLSHSAGVIRDGSDSDFWQLMRPFPDEKEFKQEFIKCKLVFDNNVKMKYSNFGYTLLGLLVQAVSGQPYNDYVQEHIVKPLGLRNTGPEPDGSIQDRLVTGYTRRDINKTRKPVAPVDTKVMSPATGFYSTTSDLCQYLMAHLVGSEKLLDDESKKEMQRTQWRVPNNLEKEEYGLGLEIVHAKERRMFGHGSGFPGQLTFSLIDPKDELAVVVLTNSVDSAVGAIAKGVFSIVDYFQEHYEAKPKRDLSKFEGRFLNLWGMVDIVATGDKIVAIYPNMWQPFYAPEELEYVDAKTLKITKADGYYQEGEKIHFKFDKAGHVKSLVYGGGLTMWPEKEYLKRLGQQRVIGDD